MCWVEYLDVTGGILRDAPFDIWGGGGARIKLKKIVCRYESQEKKFVVEIDEKYVDQKKHQNGNVHNR